MAGYSGTPLPKKLGIGAGAVVSFDSAPEDFAGTLGELPRGVRVRKTSKGDRDLIVAFFTSRSALERQIARLGQSVFPEGSLWIAWPKRSSGVETNMTEDVVRELALPLGLVDNKVCAIDEIWSGLRLVWRLEHRGGVPS